MPGDDALGRRRNSWDYVQESQRRERATAEADWRRRVATASDRPRDTWRICGHKVNYDSPGRGCTCRASGPTDREAEEAMLRLGMGDELHELHLRKAAKTPRRRRTEKD